MSAAKFQIGDVVAAGALGVEWTRGASETLSGVTGTVAKIKLEEATGHKLPEPRYLVAYDPPLKIMWRWGNKITGLWFDESELVKP